MCELWCYLDPVVAQGRQRPLPLQRLRTLLQNERPEQATHQAQETTGKRWSINENKSQLFFGEALVSVDIL